MSNSRIHLRNLSYNWGNFAATLAVMFFLSPYIIGKLDAAAYGIWSLLSVLTGYMGIFDLGVRSSVGRYVALYLGKQDERGVDETIRAGFGAFSLSAVLILIIGIMLGWYFPSLFRGVPQEYHGAMLLLLPLMVLNIWLTAIAAIYSSVLAAYDRFDVARGIDIISLVIRTIGTVYVLEMNWGLFGLTYALIVTNLYSVVANRIAAGMIHRKLRSLPLLFKRERLRELFVYGSYAFLVSTAAKLVSQSDLVIVGSLLSVYDVRQYSVGAMLIYYLTTFIKIISRTYFPAMQRAVSGKNVDETRHLFYQQLRISIIFGLLAFIGCFFYSEPFIKLWMMQPSFDYNSVYASSGVMSLLALSSIPLVFIGPSESLLAAIGRVRDTAVIYILEAVLNIVISVVLVVVCDWGLLGVASGTIFARLMTSSIYMLYHACRELGITLDNLIRKYIGPALIAAIANSLACSIVSYYYKPVTWFSFSVNILIIVCAWGLISINLLMPAETRRNIYVSLQKKNLMSFAKISIFK